MIRKCKYRLRLHNLYSLIFMGILFEDFLPTKFSALFVTISICVGNLSDFYFVNKQITTGLQGQAAIINKERKH